MDAFRDLLVTDDDLALDPGANPLLVHDRDVIAQDLVHMIRENGYLPPLVGKPAAAGPLYGGKMREAIKRIVLRMFPELAGGYHLDRYARIVRIADPPTAGSRCDRFRPYWAADIEILTPEGKPAKDFPRYEAVPLPAPMAGNDEGFFLWPRSGTIVTVRWIEGRPDHPVIQHVYPMGLSLPDVPDNMGKWQQRPGVHQVVDPAGNWERKTGRDIRDSADNIREAAAGSRSETTSGSSSEAVGGSKTVTAGSTYQVTAPTISLAAPNGGPSVLPLMSQGLEDIRAALKILADHTHPGIGAPPSQSDSIHDRADGVGATNGSLGTLQ